jgi:hypothetical protein
MSWRGIKDEIGCYYLDLAAAIIWMHGLLLPGQKLDTRIVQGAIQVA